MVWPAKLSDRTRLLRLNFLVGLLRLGKIVRVQAMVCYDKIYAKNTEQNYDKYYVFYSLFTQQNGKLYCFYLLQRPQNQVFTCSHDVLYCVLWQLQRFFSLFTSELFTHNRCTSTYLGLKFSLEKLLINMNCLLTND